VTSCRRVPPPGKDKIDFDLVSHAESHMDIVWRAIVKKYSKVREPFVAVSSQTFFV
jgi:hypothetical protein